MSKRRLSPIQEKLLDLLTKTLDDPLTIREIQDKLDFSSTSVAVHHIRQLEKKGFIRRNPNDPRDYEIVRGQPEKQVVYLNLFGLAHCNPSGSLLDGNPIDRIPVSTRLLGFSARDAFMLKAKGNSMEPRIQDGDFVIVKKARHTNSGSVAVCVNSGEVLIKKIHKKDGKIILTSINSNFPPFLAADDFRIEGEVRHIISSKIV